MFIRFMDPQSILPGETLWAESAMEEWWSVHSSLRGRNYFMVFHHLVMIALNFLYMHLANVTFLAIGRMRGSNGASDVSRYFGIIIIFLILRFEVVLFFNLLDIILMPIIFLK
jgi:hypothetical protein